GNLSLDAALLSGQINSTQITDSSVTTEKLDAGAITTAKIAAGAITTSTIAAGAITANEIGANVIGASKLVTGSAVITGTAQIQDGIITTAKIVSLNADLINTGTINVALTLGVAGKIL